VDTGKEEKRGGEWGDRPNDELDTTDLNLDINVCIRDAFITKRKGMHRP
jgi:hypothetical protein